jgi:hypothetical protein
MILYLFILGQNWIMNAYSFVYSYVYQLDLKNKKKQKTKYFVSMAINIQIREECWWLPWCNLITIPHYNLGIWTFTYIQIHFGQAMHMCVYHNIN